MSSGLDPERVLLSAIPPTQFPPLDSPTKADPSTTTDLGKRFAPALKTTNPTETCWKRWAHAGQVSRITADGASFFLPIRQTSRNRSEHFGQVATQKAMPKILSEI